jgi:CheY-like chemotaxis protein
VNQLENLNEMSFKRQITTINNLEKERQFNLIPQMFEYIKTPLKDEVTHNILEETLRNMLAKRENYCIQNLTSEDVKVRKFCLSVVKRYKISSAVPRLLKLEQTETNTSLIHEILYTISAFEIKSTVKVFKKYLNSKDELLAALAIKMIGVFKDISSFDKLADFIRDGEKEGNYESCSLIVAQSINSLSMLKTPGVIPFLADMIHHKNPTARRLIHNELYAFGDDVLPALRRILFEQNDIDKRILICNILGNIKTNSCGELLLQLLGTNTIEDNNILFALYEALGHIPCLKGSIALLNALNHRDPYVLMAVITSLNQLANPIIIKEFEKRLPEDEEQRNRIINQIVHNGAVELFAGLFPNKVIRQTIFDLVLESNNDEVKAVFLAKLKEINHPEAKLYISNLQNKETILSELKILVADDSKAMRLYFSKVGAMLGYQLITAIDGKDALDKLQFMAPQPNLIITDLNMPRMNGIEFSKKLKESELYQHIPIIIATTESDKFRIKLAEKTGISNFIQKPFHEDTLLEVIAKTLSKDFIH